MLIVSKDGGQIVNTEGCLTMYVNANGKIVLTVASTGRNENIDAYNSRNEGLVALQMLANRLKSATPSQLIVYMPTDEEVRLQMEKSDAKYRLDSGKKPTRHGGS